MNIPLIREVHIAGGLRNGKQESIVSNILAVSLGDV